MKLKVGMQGFVIIPYVNLKFYCEVLQIEERTEYLGPRTLLRNIYGNRSNWYFNNDFHFIESNKLLEELFK